MDVPNDNRGATLGEVLTIITLLAAVGFVGWVAAEIYSIMFMD